MKRLCIFCGSQPGRNPIHTETARDFGRILAEKNIGLVYGGASVGIMGVIADSALEAGGEVIGVIPDGLFEKELAHTGLSDLKVVKTMHERKALMADLSDGFVALAGGLGTLDELCEILTWVQIGIHDKPVAILNTEGFFDLFLSFMDQMVNEGFLREKFRKRIIVESDTQRLISRVIEFPSLPK